MCTANHAPRPRLPVVALILAGLVVCLALDRAAHAAPPAGGARARARDLGVPFEGTPGRYNAITDVPGVEVGQVTLIRGSGRLRVGTGPVRTGVTAVLPRGQKSRARSVGDNTQRHIDAHGQHAEDRTEDETYKDINDF